MGSYSSGGNVPYVPQPTMQMPTYLSQNVVDAANQTKARLAAAGGFGGTMVTGGQGVTAPAAVGGKTMLGS